MIAVFDFKAIANGNYVDVCIYKNLDEFKKEVDADDYCVEGSVFVYELTNEAEYRRELSLVPVTKKAKK